MFAEHDARGNPKKIQESLSVWHFGFTWNAQCTVCGSPVISVKVSISLSSTFTSSKIRPSQQERWGFKSKPLFWVKKSSQTSHKSCFCDASVSLSAERLQHSNDQWMWFLILCAYGDISQECYLCPLNWHFLLVEKGIKSPLGTKDFHAKLLAWRLDSEGWSMRILGH
jgi:hypothetical protein